MSDTKELITKIQELAAIAVTFKVKDTDGIQVALKLGELEASVSTIPTTVRYSGGRRQAPKKATLEQVEAIVMENPSEIEKMEPALDKFIITTKKDISNWREIYDKLKEIGGKYNPDNKTIEVMKA